MWGDKQSLSRVPPLLKAIEQLAGHGDGSAVVPPAGVDASDAIAAGGNPEAGQPQPSRDPAPPGPYTPLRLWAQARLYAQDGQHKEADVLAAYDAALTLQPELRRARYELAVYQLDHGHPDMARPLLEDLAHGQPPHTRAQELLTKLAQGPAQSEAP